MERDVAGLEGTLDGAKEVVTMIASEDRAVVVTEDARGRETATDTDGGNTRAGMHRRPLRRRPWSTSSVVTSFRPSRKGKSENLVFDRCFLKLSTPVSLGSGHVNIATLHTSDFQWDSPRISMVVQTVQQLPSKSLLYVLPGCFTLSRELFGTPES